MATRLMTRPSVDQLAGSILGLALGDALGAGVEALPPAEARHYADKVLRCRQLPTRGPAGHRFGQVTDDTQLARELLRCVGPTGEFDAALFGERLVNLVASGRLIGAGPAPNAAARQLAQGVPWHEAGVPAPYAGNGAAMRAAPLGLLYGRNPRELARIVSDQARVTHQDARAGAGALAIAGATAIAARGGPIVPTELLVELSRWVEPLDPAMALTIWELSTWCQLAPEAAADHLRAHGLEPETSGGWHGISSFVVSSVCWSLYSFLRAPNDYWDAVTIAIAIGGDTDTLAAMTGGIVGGRIGAGKLPVELLPLLTDQGAPLWPDLERLASSLEQALG